jgi:putative endonuclease
VSFWTYILASQRNGTLYAGSTDDLARRIHEHRTKAFDGFTAEYGVARLVWCEQHETREAAFTRERRIKKWNRPWKLALIERFNPAWRDLLEDVTGTTSDIAGQTEAFLAALRMEAEKQKSLDPRLRGDERGV